MNKQDLIDSMAAETALSRLEAKKVVNLFFQSMTNALAKGNRVEIRGLGAFAVKKYKAYKGRSPKTGEPVNVKPKKLPFFRVGKELRERVDFK